MSNESNNHTPTPPATPDFERAANGTLTPVYLTGKPSALVFDEPVRERDLLIIVTFALRRLYNSPEALETMGLVKKEELEKLGYCKTYTSSEVKEMLKLEPVEDAQEFEQTFDDLAKQNFELKKLLAALEKLNKEMERELKDELNQIKFLLNQHLDISHNHKKAMDYIDALLGKEGE